MRLRYTVHAASLERRPAKVTVDGEEHEVSRLHAVVELVPADGAGSSYTARLPIASRKAGDELLARFAPGTVCVLDLEPEEA